MSVAKCNLINLPKIADQRGNLTFIEESNHIPFNIARVYYLYDVPSGVDRAGHAHKDLEQILIALSGSFSVELDDGKEKKDVFLSQPNQGLYIGSMVWRELKSFSAGSVCLVLASRRYDESDYFRNYNDFINVAMETT
jgi:dTDP-4-dehydrorhamnose 3,5-epimerase-like enzyme